MRSELQRIFAKPARSWRIVLVGAIISAIGMGLVVREVDVDRLSRALQAADYRWVLIGVLAIVVTFFTRTRRWAGLLRPMRLRAPTIMTALLIGQVLNFVLPVRLGDVTRALLVGRAPHSSVERALGSVAIEKAWDWITLTLIVLIVMLVMPLPGWFLAPARIVGIVTASVLVVFAIIACSPAALRSHSMNLIDRAVGGLPPRWRQFLLERLQRLLDSLTALRQRESIAHAAAWSIITWSLGIAANYAVLRAFGVESWIAAMLLMAVLMIGVTLPPSIAAIGLFEGLTILTLSAFDVPRETALAIGLILHVVIYAPPIVAAPIIAARTSL